MKNFKKFAAIAVAALCLGNNLSTFNMQIPFESGISANAADLTQKSVHDTIFSFREKYPDETKWDNSKYYIWNGGIYADGYGCAAFAFELSDAAFGKLPARCSTTFDPDSVRIGDIIHYSSHFFIVLDLYDGGFVAAEGNLGGMVYWGRKISYEEIEGSFEEHLTRYPESMNTENEIKILQSGKCGEDGYDISWSLDSKGTLTISGDGEMDSWALTPPWKEYAANITKVVIENGVTTIGEHAFNGCNKIETISIPDTVTNIKTAAFFECTGLTSIEIPESVTEMGHSVFYGCTNLKEANIPDGVDTIYSGSFRSCENLSSMTFSENVKKVDFAVLCDCTNLNSVTFLNSECKIADAEYTICNSHDFDTKENVFNGTIYGYNGSTAQEYAEKYGRIFVSLGDDPATTTITTTTATTSTTTATTSTATTTTTSTTSPVTTTAPVTTPPVVKPTYTRGDVNEDGKVDSVDASLVLAEYALLQTGMDYSFTISQRLAADVNGSLSIDSSDASKILEYYASISTGNPPVWK